MSIWVICPAWVTWPSELKTIWSLALPAASCVTILTLAAPSAADQVSTMRGFTVSEAPVPHRPAGSSLAITQDGPSSERTQALLSALDASLTSQKVMSALRRSATWRVFSMPPLSDSAALRIARSCVQPTMLGTATFGLPKIRGTPCAHGPACGAPPSARW